MVNPAVTAAALARKVLRGTEGSALGSGLSGSLIGFS
jgi:hypothetical protein